MTSIPANKQAEDVLRTLGADVLPWEDEAPDRWEDAKQIVREQLGLAYQIGYQQGARGLDPDESYELKRSARDYIVMLILLAGGIIIGVQLCQLFDLFMRPCFGS